MSYGKHSTAIVHRVVKRGKRANARKRAQFNRRLITLEKFKAWGPNTEKTLELVEKEQNYHFTKGYRRRTA